MATSPPTSDQPIGDARVRVLSGTSARAVFLLCVLWSLFQVYVASSIPFWLSSLTGISLVFNNQEVRQLHLAFGLVLAMLLHPLGKNSTQPIPWYDILLALLGASSCLYLLVFKDSIADRAGLPTTSDLIISTIGLCCLGLAVYRALGLPLLVVAGVFLSYVFFGDKSFIPEVIQWKGASLNKALWHFWMQTEGVFGVALGVSSSMIFLFVLFGALLERAGAGQYFIQLAFALLGHFRGGPAKAAVVASGLSGLYSGSSIANVVTTGTFRALPETDPVAAEVYDYVMERLRGYYVETAPALSGDLLDAVLARRPGSPLDLDTRLHALSAFVALPEAASLTAANKRIA
ncbi:MAG: TRAP transporter large permease subunit, partial [bacterium]